MLVSIHAPARGATQAPINRHFLQDVSIHAPARGATHVVLRKARRIWFQFTRPRGARHCGLQSILGCNGFNSRAREGRDTVWKPLIHALQFQFTRPRGARRSASLSSWLGNKFQFTLPRGARQATRASTGRTRRFNSRARDGRDGWWDEAEILRDAFQFTRPRGARPRQRRADVRQGGFNSRAREGRDRNMWKMIRRGAFQFTRPRGARH